MDFKNAWERITKETKIKTLADLGKIIGKTSQNISTRKKKGNFPIEWAYLVGKKYQLSLDWILDGTGPKRINQVTDTREPSKEYILELEEWLVEITEDDPRKQYWFECTIEESFPGFKQWRRKKAKTNYNDNLNERMA